MDENPFRTDRYATAPKYGTDATRFSADPQSAAAGQTGDAAGSDSVDHGGLPLGEYVRPLSATSATGNFDPFAASTPQGDSAQGTANSYGDRYADRSGDEDPFAAGRAANNNDNSLQEANGQDSANTSSGGLKLSDIDTSKDAFGRSRPEEETAPPTLNPDNATRLANYRDDEQGPSGSDKKSASTPPEEQGKSSWQWALLVLAMCASLGANGWMALLLRDSRRKYSQLLERFQQGDDKEYEDEEDVHYEAA
jgi:hypothetical protein